MDRTREASPSKRGRHRSKEADDAILVATRAILLELGYQGFTIGEVIKRAGVSSATIYRRWPSSQLLILDALRSLMREIQPVNTGSFADDLSQFVDDFAEALTSIGGLIELEKKGPAADPELRREIAAMFTEPRKRQFADILKRAVRNNELGKLPNLEDCWEFVAGPLHHRINLEPRRYTPKFAKQAKAFILAGVHALASL